MRIRFVTPYFPPEVGAPQTRLYELAIRLASFGHDVSVLTTFPSYPTGVRTREWRGKLYCSSIDNGLNVYRVWSYAAPNRGFVKRLISHLSFAISSSVAGLFLPDCDGTIVESPPLFDGFIGVFSSLFKHVPYLFMVSDLWPESAVQMGVLHNRILIRAAKYIELMFYRRAAAVLALTVGIRKGILSDGIEQSKVLLFRNSVDCDFFRPGVSAAAIRKELQIGNGEFLVLYAGTLGLAQNLKVVLQAAAMLQEQRVESVHFVLVGEGAESEQLRAYARQMQLANVTIRRSIQKQRMPELLNAADCVLVPLRGLEIFRGALPTKMFEAMACGRPVVLGVQGEAEAVLRDAGAGYCVSPDDPKSLFDGLLSVLRSPQEAAERGRRGREYVADQFSRDKRAEELNQIIHEYLPPTPSSSISAGTATERTESRRAPTPEPDAEERAQLSQG